MVMSVPSKATLREEIRGRLLQMSEGARAEASQQIEKHLLARVEWQVAGVVALFLSLTDEPQTRGILSAAWAAGNLEISSLLYQGARAFKLAGKPYKGTSKPGLALREASKTGS